MARTPRPPTRPPPPPPTETRGQPRPVPGAPVRCRRYVRLWRWIAPAIDAALAEQAAQHDSRVAELLAANNREVNRRRAAEDALHGLLAAVEQVEQIGLDEDLYQAALSQARAVLANA